MIEIQAPPATGGILHRLIVIDDHPLVRRGLTSIINGEPDLEVCAAAADRQTGLELIASAGPDLVTVDLSLGQCDGLGLIKDIRARFPTLPVLVISMHDEAIYAERAFRAGAGGYINKEQMDETVLAAIRCVLQGKRYMSPAMRSLFEQQYLAKRPRRKNAQITVLSDRELEVFRLIGEGNGTRQIAERLRRSIKTIESHRENLKSKLTLHSAAELARAAACWVETGRTK
jgi:DNA-binding NarL/FixJ family response regulator